MHISNRNIQVDDTVVNGATESAASSNWAHDHAADIDAHVSGATAGQLLVATAAAIAVWESTGVVLSAPDISGVVTAASALTMPAFTAGGDISMGANKLKTTNLLLKEGSGSTIHIRNTADDAYKELLADALMADGSFRANANAVGIWAANSNDAYMSLLARDTDVGLVEIARMQGAADPYFSIGGSQEFKFYYSGVADFGGDVTIGANKLKTTNLLLKEGSGSTIHIRNTADDAYKELLADALMADGSFRANANAVGIWAANSNDAYMSLLARDTDVGLVEIARMQGAADPYFSIGRDDTGVALNAITDGLVLQVGGGTGNEAQGQGFGIAFNIGNAASEVEKRGAINCYLQTATNGSEDSQLHFWTMAGGTLNQAFKVDEAGIGYFDAAGAGDAVPTLFDGYDDAVVIKAGIQQRNRELLTDIGVMERKDTGSGHFVKLQPMFNLLGGGIYQNRARIDDLVEVLVSEFPQVAERLVERNLLTLPIGRN